MLLLFCLLVLSGLEGGGCNCYSAINHHGPPTLFSISFFMLLLSQASLRLQKKSIWLSCFLGMVNCEFDLFLFLASRPGGRFDEYGWLDALSKRTRHLRMSRSLKEIEFDGHHDKGGIDLYSSGILVDGQFESKLIICMSCEMAAVPRALFCFFSRGNKPSPRFTRTNGGRLHARPQSSSPSLE